MPPRSVRSSNRSSRRSSRRSSHDKSRNADAPTTPPKTNKEGEVTSWDGGSPDAKMLKVIISDGMATKSTAAVIKSEFLQFQKYNTRTLNSAIQNMKKSLQNEVDLRKKSVSSGEFG